MKRKYLFFVLFSLFVCSLSAQQELLEKQFYYYKGKKVYLEIDYSRMSIISEGKISMEDVRKVVDTIDFSIINEHINYTRQNVVPFGEPIDREIIISEIEFSKNLNQTDYFDITQHLLIVNNILKISPTHTVSRQKLGISNNFYVKLFKEEDLVTLFDLADEYFMSISKSGLIEDPINGTQVVNLFWEKFIIFREKIQFFYELKIKSKKKKIKLYSS